MLHSFRDLYVIADWMCYRVWFFHGYKSCIPAHKLNQIVRNWIFQCKVNLQTYDGSKSCRQGPSHAVEVTFTTKDIMMLINITIFSSRVVSFDYSSPLSPPNKKKSSSSDRLSHLSFSDWKSRVMLLLQCCYNWKNVMWKM